MSELFPFAGLSDEQMDANVGDEQRRRAAVEALRSAREAEEKGLAALGKIFGKMQEKLASPLPH